ncbi:MAG: LD-carboxypeptidase [Bdellovibrionales bacterium]|nr:LD-carboxypeptidase [Bdellovibrionales bacterium]
MASKASAASSGKWQALKPGDLIDVVSPGFRPLDEEVEAGVRFLEGWGLRARLPKDLFGPDVISSNTDEKRFRHLAKALTAKDSRGVWCLRGGYGSIRLVPGLLKLRKPARSKVLIGYSDITTIQLFLRKKWGWCSLHASLLDRLGRTVDASLVTESKPLPVAAQVEELHRVLFGDEPILTYEGLRPHGGRKLVARASAKQGLIRGTMTGGNLVTFASAIGTGLHPKTAGQIVFFEDIGERGYRIDRLLEQMVQAGVLTDKTRAIVFGEFTGGFESDGSSRLSDVIERFASTWGKKNDVPVLTGLASGHGVNQRALPIGTKAVLDMAAGALMVESGVSK